MHLIEYKGQNRSGPVNQNLLWSSGSVYIMDNHRAAAWCWAQHIPTQDNYRIFHIDRHSDLLQSNLEAWSKEAPPIESLSIEKYLNYPFAKGESHSHPLFTWANYLPIFIKQREERMLSFCYMWHSMEDGPWFDVCRKEYYDAPDNLDFWLKDSTKWIVNLDIDFFFADAGDETFLQLHSDHYIKSIGSGLKKALDKGNIKCLTIAISPEFCGGWEAGLRVLSIVAKELEIENFDI